MNKNDFLLAVHEYLKAFGYRKNKSYWFLSNGELVYCVYVQSSQWDANDYYVEVGIAIEEIVGPKPSVTRWYVRKRCEDESQNDRNISLSVLKQAIDFFSDLFAVLSLCGIALSIGEQLVLETYKGMGTADWFTRWKQQPPTGG